ncbi:hypothetical protein J2W25_001062 [Variovorax boronicumulans]|uniref:Uncharacterized protein n=1 Tax=Variovorax boronicumulans TaxID=436515 RepID=A0AAW8DRV4_9BURK|nr:hypothetical protein [Variovorax boronicumulans]MDP9877076.1 hypothetical protein [Variovorax boronicumulans]MDP9922047.1 hypothetical protein [Variovorax boronicumulans]
MRKKFNLIARLKNYLFRDHLKIQRHSDSGFVLESANHWVIFWRHGEGLVLADSTHSREARRCRQPLPSGCSHRLPTISMERIVANEADPTSTSTEPNSLHHKGFSRRTQKNSVRQAGREAPQPANQPLTAGLKRPTSRLLAHLKQRPSLASKFSRKPKHVIQLSRLIPAAPVGVFPVADPQKSFELREGVFEKIRRVLGVVFGSYRRARPGYSLGSHFCAFPSKVLHELG